MRTTGQALRRLRDDALSADAKARALDAFRAQRALPHEIGVASNALFAQTLAGVAAPPIVPTVVAVGVSAVLGGVGASHYAQAPGPWLWAGLTAVGACVLAFIARKNGLAAASVAFSAALLSGLLGAAGVTDADAVNGARCGLHELVTASFALGALLATRGQARLRRSTLAGVAAAGALAGDAALHVVCAGSGSVGHVLVFHVGGLVLATLSLALLLPRILGPARMAT